MLGEETSRNPQAYRRGHLDIIILNKIRAAKECGRYKLRNYFNENSSTLFLKVEKLDKLVIEAGRQIQTLGPWQRIVNFLMFVRQECTRYETKKKNTVV